MTDVIRSSNESAIVDQLMHAPFTTAAMRRQAAETIARLMVERDDAKADYARVHRDYMNYRYGGSPPGTPPGRLADETPTHETSEQQPVAWRRVVDSAYTLKPEMIYTAQAPTVAPEKWEALYARGSLKANSVAGEKS